MNKKCCIYKIISPSNKIYIGQTRDLIKRKSRYKNLQCKGQFALYNSLSKYGWEAHKFEVLQYCEESELNTLEKYYVDLYQSFGTEHGLNLRDGGVSNGLHSEATRLKMSLAKKGKPSPRKGIKVSDKERERLANFNKGKKASLETRRKISESMKNRELWNRGKKGIYSKEHLEKMSISQNKRYANTRHSQYGIPRSSETIKKMSEALKGKIPWNKGIPMKQEQKEKVAQWSRKYWDTVFEERRLMIF